MKLHEDKIKFNDGILAISSQFNIYPALIEKDYYVTTIIKSNSFAN